MKSRCEHCGAEHKSSVACGWFADKPDWMQRNYDPPCSFDEYDETMREVRRREIFWDVMALVVVIALFALVAWTFGG